MFLCRAGRLSAVDPVFRSFLARVTVNTQREVTVTAHRGQVAAPHRSFCTSGLEPPASLSSGYVEKPNPEQHRDFSCGFLTTTQRVHVDRLALVHHTGPAHSDIIRLLYAHGRHKSTAQPRRNRLFPGSTMTVQTRSSSSSAASKKDQQERTDTRKEDVQTVTADQAASSSETSPGDSEPEGGKPNKTQQLKKVFKEYGAVGVSFHIGISLMSLGMFYLLISSGIDMAALLCKLGFSEAMVQSKLAAGTSTFVLAYAVHKLFAPVRISITLVSVPLIVRYFRKTGLFKPPTPAP